MADLERCQEEDAGSAAREEEGALEKEVAAKEEGNLLPPTNTEATRRLRALLQTRIRAKLSDGRILYGNFLCTDRDRNLVLGQCEEHRTVDGTDFTSAATLRRQLALLMVPGEHLVSFASLNM